MSRLVWSDLKNKPLRSFKVTRVLSLPWLVACAFWGECRGVRQMMAVFWRVLRCRWTVSGSPTPEELANAVAQLRDLPRLLPILLLLTMPLPGVTEGYLALALGMEKGLGSKVRILPRRLHDLVEDPRVNALFRLKQAA